MDEDPNGAVIEKLRRLALALPISCDRMLKGVEGLPPFVGERAQQTAERLTFFCTRLEELFAKLPDDLALPTTITEDLAALRGPIEGVLRQLDLMLADLRCMLVEPADPEAHPKLCN